MDAERLNPHGGPGVRLFIHCQRQQEFSSRREHIQVEAIEITGSMEGECRPITWGGVVAFRLSRNLKRRRAAADSEPGRLCCAWSLCGFAVIYCVRIQGHGNPASDVLALDCRPADRPERKTEENTRLPTRQLWITKVSKESGESHRENDGPTNYGSVGQTDYTVIRSIAGKCPRSLLTSGTTLTGVG